MSEIDDYHVYRTEDEKDKRIAELEKENERLKLIANDTFDYCEAVRKVLLKKAPEQQAEGAEYTIKNLIGYFDDNRIVGYDADCLVEFLRYKAQQLRNQAKENNQC